jgi:phosphoribosylformylglycinamidine synthase subunit PurQ / glutaminase
MRAAVVVFPGTNRERDMALALARAAGGDGNRRPLMLWHGEAALPGGLDLVVLPGGFSYGDYLRCGAMAAHSPIMRAVKEFAARGGHVLGVCNGFQILCEVGMLPGALLRNASLRFLSMDCWMRVERADTPFTNRFRPGDTFRATMAHGDGNYFADEDTLDRLEGENLVALRYATPAGETTGAANRNGSARGIAGVLSPNLRVLGVMPHPENQVDPVIDGTDGLPLFESLASAFASA